MCGYTIKKMHRLQPRNTSIDSFSCSTDHLLLLNLDTSIAHFLVVEFCVQDALDVPTYHSCRVSLKYCHRPLHLYTLCSVGVAWRGV